MSEKDVAGSSASGTGGGAGSARRRRRRRSSRGRGRGRSAAAQNTTTQGATAQGSTTQSASTQGSSTQKSATEKSTSGNTTGSSGQQAPGRAGSSAGGSNPRSRRRRRSRGGKRQHRARNAAQNAANNTADNASGNTSGNASGNVASSAQKKGNQKKNNQVNSGQAQGKATNKQNNKQANNRSGKNAARRQPNGSHLKYSDMPLSIETSAGGLVISGLAEAVQPNGSVDLSKVYVALIGRLDRRGRLLWSMPKGHIENNESRHTTAEREVWEETGISGEVISNLGSIDYWFVSDGTRIHKTVHHHLLRFIDGDLNDEDPEVTEVAWVPVNQLVEKLAYADERRLARRAFDSLPKFARQEAEAGRLTPR